MSERANITIEQGADFAATVDLKDDNGDIIWLQGYYANAAMKKWYTSTTIAAVFGTNINVASGEVTISLPANTTGQIKSGRYVYDVYITSSTSNTVQRIMEGIATVTPGVSYK